MKLFICTQAVDTQDPVLRFFIRWIEEFAKHCEKIIVVCLREGTHQLPANVEVVVLGEVARWLKAFRLLRISVLRRNDYDAVFVHMNPEYIVIAGLLWHTLHKRIALWYTHKSVNLKLRIAVFFANVIFTASTESFRIQSRKVKVVGHGIDVDFFYPEQKKTRGTTVLSAGRLSLIKRHDLVIHAAEHFPNEVHIVGDGPEKQYLKDLAKQLSITSRVHFLGAETQERLREEYRRAGVLVHTSETGSLDKIVLEALACGLPVITTNLALSGLPVVIVDPTANAIAKEVFTIRTTNPQTLFAYVREHHSLQRLIPVILNILQSV